MSPAAVISGICPVSPGSEMAAFAETTLLARHGILCERLPARRRKYLFYKKILI